MSSGCREAITSLRAVADAASRQRHTLVRGDRAALRAVDETLLDLLPAVRTAGRVQDAAAARLAREVREQLRINAALAENGRVMAEHLAAGLAEVRRDGALGCQLEQRA